MLRLLGGSMIIIGCLGLGMWYRGQFILRLKNVRSLQGILEMLMSEIRYGKTPLPECCKRIGERQPEPFGEAFLGIYHCMQENPGESFPKVFCEIMEECLQKLPVTKQDTEDFLAFAVGLVKIFTTITMPNLMGHFIPILHFFLFIGKGFLPSFFFHAFCCI